MHNLFNTQTSISDVTHTLNGWNNARKALYAEMNKLASRFREASDWLNNSHPLVQLLTADRTPLLKDADSMIDMARRRWLRDAQLYGISTIYTRVNSRADNIAYPNTVREYLAMDDSIPYGNEIKLNWKDLEPIKVLDHPYYDLNLSIPNGKFTGEMRGQPIACISINIPVLVLQYRMWQKYEAERQGIEIDNPAIFLIRYPLFNILNSHMNVVIKNRLELHYRDVEPAKFKRLNTGGVAVNDTSHYVDRALLHLTGIMKNGKFRFDEINALVPQLSLTSVKDTLYLPEMTFTRSVRWAYDLSRLRWLAFLLEYNEEVSSERNRDELAYVQRRLKVMKNDREFYESLGVTEDGLYARIEKLVN